MASHLTRRGVLQGSAAGAVFVWLGCNSDSPAQSDAGNDAAAPLDASVTGKNVLVIITDQERFHMNWPDGWADQNLPALARLKAHGLSFENAYTAACECSPSRAVMMTGQMSDTTGVAITFTKALPTSIPTVGTLLKQLTSYAPHWRGKWHLSTTSTTSAMESSYGFSGWDPPDSGNAIITPDPKTIATAGGGSTDNDSRYVADVIDFLTNVAPTLGGPFCLFVSLVNPHDICAYPQGFSAAGYDASAFAGLGIELPANFKDDLTKKPSIQTTYSQGCMSALPLTSQRTAYVNFYAYLQTLVDGHIGAILDALDAAGLTNDTIVIRTADHGELGLSHAMTEKSYTAYEEMTHIPFIVSNPVIFPTALTTKAFYDHQDLLPTVLELAGVDAADGYGNGVGKSIVPVLRDPTTSVRDHALFAFDDVFGLPASSPGSHIRSIRIDGADGRWTYSVYFNPSGGPYEYELYELGADPGQLTNLLSVIPPDAATATKWQALHTALTASFTTAKQLPAGWPTTPS